MWIFFFFWVLQRTKAEWTELRERNFSFNPNCNYKAKWALLNLHTCKRTEEHALLLKHVDLSGYCLWFHGDEYFAFKSSFKSYASARLRKKTVGYRVFIHHLLVNYNLIRSNLQAVCGNCRTKKCFIKGKWLKSQNENIQQLQLRQTGIHHGFCVEWKCWRRRLCFVEGSNSGLVVVLGFGLTTILRRGPNHLFFSGSDLKERNQDKHRPMDGWVEGWTKCWMNRGVYAGMTVWWIMKGWTIGQIDG